MQDIFAKIKKYYSIYSKETGQVLNILGSLATATALISLIQHIGKITLTDFFLHLVEFYRDLMRGLVDWMPLPNNFKLPQWYLDAFSISSFFSGTYIKTLKKLDQLNQSGNIFLYSNVNGSISIRRFRKANKAEYIGILIMTFLLISIVLPIKELFLIQKQLKEIRLRNELYKVEFDINSLQDADFDTKDKFYTERRFADDVKKGWQEINEKLLSESKLYFRNLIIIALAVLIFFICSYTFK